MSVPITRAQLIQGILDLMDGQSNDPEVDPAEARQQFAEGLGNLIADFTVGRETIVTGTSASGGPVTGTGIIQE